MLLWLMNLAMGGGGGAAGGTERTWTFVDSEDSEVVG